MPLSQVIEHVEDGILRRFGCLHPDTYPVAMAARDAGLRIFSIEELTELLSKIPDGRGFHNSHQVFDRTWILDQKQTSGCNGNSTAGALTRQLYNSTGVKVLLSGGDAYSQMNGGHDNGSVLAEGMKVVVNGIAPLTFVPNATIFSKDISLGAKQERSKYRGHEPLGLDSELELATFIVLHKVAIVCVQAGGNFSRFDDHGLCQGGNGSGNHSVGVDDVRLRNGVLEFDMFNSWSGTWGQGGRTWLQWNKHLRDSVRVHRFWGLPSAKVAQGSIPLPK